MAAIAHLLQHETGGDPMQDLKWSRRAIRKIARQLRRLKIRVSATTVRRLLKQLGFSLRVNHKRLESGNKNPPPRRGVFVARFQPLVIHPQTESQLFQQAAYGSGANPDLQPTQLASDFSDGAAGPF